MDLPAAYTRLLPRSIAVTSLSYCCREMVVTAQYDCRYYTPSYHHHQITIAAPFDRHYHPSYRLREINIVTPFDRRYHPVLLLPLDGRYCPVRSPLPSCQMVAVRLLSPPRPISFTTPSNCRRHIAFTIPSYRCHQIAILPPHSIAVT